MRIKKYILSYSGEEKLKYLDLKDILRGEEIKENDEYIRLSNGVVIKELGDGRLYDEDTDEEYERVLEVIEDTDVNGDVEYDFIKEIGFIKC